MKTRHELHAYDYVNFSYPAVRDALLDDAVVTLERATVVAARRAESIGAELRATVGGVTVGAAIEIELVRIQTAIGPGGRPATNLTLRWGAAEHASLFPTMSAVLSIYPLTATETQLDLSGTYSPPLGLVGEALDALVLHHLAKESVAGFIQSVAKFLREQLSLPVDARPALHG